MARINVIITSPKRTVFPLVELFENQRQTPGNAIAPI